MKLTNNIEFTPISGNMEIIGTDLRTKINKMFITSPVSMYIRENSAYLDVERVHAFGDNHITIRLILSDNLNVYWLL